MQEVLVPIFLFGGAAVVLWKFFDSRHRERMAMIDKGLRPADFQQAGPQRTTFFSADGSLKWGLLAVFAGLGVFFANWLHEARFMDEGPANFGSVFVFGGIALVLHYLIAARRLRKEEKQSQS